MSQAKESKGLRATFEQWQSAIDERIRAVSTQFLPPFESSQQDVKRLADRLDELEKRAGAPPNSGTGDGSRGAE